MSTTSVLYKTRRILGDMGSAFTAEIPGDGRMMRFELEDAPVDQVIAQVEDIGGGSQRTLVVGTDYSLDSYNGVITLTSPLQENMVLVVNGVGYEYFADYDLTDYVYQAFAQHTQGRNPPVYLDPVQNAIPPTQLLPVIEERPVALLAAKLVMDDQATDVSKDITIDTGDGTVIPRSQRYQQYVSESERLQQAYEELCAHLGIQSFTNAETMQLRRVSLTTNRLVPVYVPMEWDNRRFPQRVLPPIDRDLGDQGQVITERGEWDASRQYNVNDTVFYGGQEYLCYTDNTGVNPQTDVAAGNGWQGQYWEKTYINSGISGLFGVPPWF